MDFDLIRSDAELGGDRPSRCFCDGRRPIAFELEPRHLDDLPSFESDLIAGCASLSHQMAAGPTRFPPSSHGPQSGGRPMSSAAESAWTRFQAHGPLARPEGFEPPTY
jgi:hypothetical protein